LDLVAAGDDAMVEWHRSRPTTDDG